MNYLSTISLESLTDETRCSSKSSHGHFKLSRCGVFLSVPSKQPTTYLKHVVIIFSYKEYDFFWFAEYFYFYCGIWIWYVFQKRLLSSEHISFSFFIKIKIITLNTAGYSCTGVSPIPVLDRTVDWACTRNPTYNALLSELERPINFVWLLLSCSSYLQIKDFHRCKMCTSSNNLTLNVIANCIFKVCSKIYSNEEIKDLKHVRLKKPKLIKYRSSICCSPFHILYHNES